MKRLSALLLLLLGGGVGFSGEPPVEPPPPKTLKLGYEIEGRLLEVCTCNVLCPCWVGEDPDYTTCDTTIAWGIETGTIDGVSVDGLIVAVSAHIPKNILIPKSWKAVVFVDDRATDDQQGALLRLFTGQLGGAVADLAGLIGEVVAVERVPIAFTCRAMIGGTRRPTGSANGGSQMRVGKGDDWCCT